MATRRVKITNTLIQAIFMGTMGILCMACGAVLWPIGTAAAYVGSICTICIGAAIVWHFAIHPMLALRHQVFKDTPTHISAHFDENQAMTWSFAIGGGAFVLVTAVLVAAWLDGNGPRGAVPARFIALGCLLLVIDAIGIWGWCRVFRSAANKRLFRGLRMRITSGNPRIESPIDFAIGPLPQRLQRMLDQSLLTGHLECRADLEFTATGMMEDRRGHRNPQKERASTLERVAEFAIALSPRMRDDAVDISGTTTPLSAAQVRERCVFEPRYLHARRVLGGLAEYCERWTWIVRLRAGNRSCFFPLALFEIVVGEHKPDDDELDAHDEE